MDLTQLSPTETRVGYGRLGLGGELGYEGRRVHVGGLAHVRAISAHAPSNVHFLLDGRFSALHCRVAINDDVPAGAAVVTFSVVADGRVIASVADLTAGASARELVAPLAGVRRLELRAETANRNYSHAVWIEPVLEEIPRMVGSGEALAWPLPDCLDQTEIVAAPGRPRAARCVATLAEPGDAFRLDALLGSLRANGLCHDAALVVLAVGADEDRARVALKYGATLVPCRFRDGASIGKGALYSVARAFDAERYLCLDPDLLVLGDLHPLFAAVEAAPAGSVLAVRDGNGRGPTDLAGALRAVLAGGRGDRATLGVTAEDEQWTHLLDDGLFAGDRAALLALDEGIRGVASAADWIARRRDDGGRTRFIFNLAIARMGRASELDPTWNVQLRAQEIAWNNDARHPQALWRGRPARALRFDVAAEQNERGRRYAAVSDPLPSTGGGDLYTVFVEALRSWVGEIGVSALQWSFYGVAEGDGARVADSSVFPLLALLHYLVRSNGCTRIIEAGTAAGVSAACLASAVAHREGGRVVTFDPWDHPRRAALWSLLPPQIRGCLDERRESSIEGMMAELDAGRRYEAALLDSVHHEDHVWREFELAAELVCPGGLIIIHDATFAGGTVAAAIARIEAAGYGVTRLWTATGGVHEDDRLGLAVIENRRRADAPPAPRVGR